MFDYITAYIYQINLKENNEQHKSLIQVPRQYEATFRKDSGRIISQSKTQLTLLKSGKQHFAKPFNKYM